MEKRKQIKVTECRAYGPQFANLTPGSVHDVIPAPPGYENSGGVWVEGVGEPVKLLDGEYMRVEDIKVCCICGKEYAGHGNNPYPIKEDGECCQACNWRVVLPKRIELSKREHEQRTGKN